MSPRRSRAALTASPVLVGAVTVLVTIVAVFLSYNANTGLPFVPTYDLKANLPNASQLVEGFDVRIGGARVGQVSKITPKRRPDGSAYAQITLKLDKEVEPLPADSTVLVRPRSALGLKYLRSARARARPASSPGPRSPSARRGPRSWRSTTSSTCSTTKARVGSRNSLDGFGTGLAGRGRDLNTAIDELRPLLDDLEPVAKNLASPRTRIDRFFKALADTATEVAPVAEEQASMFVNLDTTFTALSTIARPFLQESISEGPATEQVSIRRVPEAEALPPQQRGVLPRAAPGRGHAAALGADPGRRLPGGHREPAQDEGAERQAGRHFRHPRQLLPDPLVKDGVAQLTRLSSLAAAHACLPHPGPDHLQLRHAVLPQRRQRALRRLRERHLAALHDHPHHARQGHRDLRAAQQRDRPSDSPANGPGQFNHLHTNPYPNTASPGPDQGVRGR